MNQQLAKIAQEYNALLAQYILGNNEGLSQADPNYVFRLSNSSDLHRLKQEGYDVFSFSVKGDTGLGALDDLCTGETANWVFDTLIKGKRDYRTLERGISAVQNPELAAAVGVPLVQRGLAVVGENTDVSAFEYHERGIEVILPRYFDSVAVITQGYDFSKGAIDLATARLVWMPANKDFMPSDTESLAYGFGKNACHLYPHILAVNEVMLADGTGTQLTAYERRANAELGFKLYVKQNLALLTGDRLQNEAQAKKVLDGLQAMVNRDFRPQLERVLRGE